MKTKNQAGRAGAKLASFADVMGPFGSGVGGPFGSGVGGVLDADLGLPKTRKQKPPLASVTDKTATITEYPLVRPRQLQPDEEGDLGPATWYVKSPSVVVRMDGRYGVAYSDTRLPWKRGGRRPQYAHTRGLASSESSGFLHLQDENGSAVTFGTRGEAEARAWKLAREIGSMRDWP